MISTGYDDEQLSALIQDLFNVMASGGLYSTIYNNSLQS